MYCPIFIDVRKNSEARDSHIDRCFRSPFQECHVIATVNRQLTVLDKFSVVSLGLLHHPLRVVVRQDPEAMLSVPGSIGTGSAAEVQQDPRSNRIYNQLSKSVPLPSTY